jgi:cold shock CspA family protein
VACSQGYRPDRPLADPAQVLGTGRSSFCFATGFRVTYHRWSGQYSHHRQDHVTIRVRSKGKITFWNDDKGYGFITPSAGSKQVFVHISAFGNRNRRPEINQFVTFSLSTDKQGRPCAMRVAMAGEQIPNLTKRNGRLLLLIRAGLFLVIVGILWTFAYSQYQKYQPSSYAPIKAPASTNSNSRQATPSPSPSRCDGRTYCSQMNSCAEAKYFIRNCPDTKMDGDGDGVPCESQWCD